MFEILLSASIDTRILVVDSGPGSKYIAKGNKDFGFFEVVSASTFGTTEALMENVRTLGVTLSPGYKEFSWYKFIFKDRVIFFPSQALGTTTLASIFSENITFDALKPYPESPRVIPYTNTSMYQGNDSVIGPDGTVFRIRLFSPKTGTYFGQAIDDANSEFYNVFKTTFNSNINSPIGVKYESSYDTVRPIPLAATTGENTPIGIVSNQIGVLSTLEIATGNIVQWVPVLEVVTQEMQGEYNFPPSIMGYGTDIVDNSQEFEISTADLNLPVSNLHIVDPAAAGDVMDVLPVDIVLQVKELHIVNPAAATDISDILLE